MEYSASGSSTNRNNTPSNPNALLGEDIIQLKKLRGKDLELNAEKYPIETKICTDTRLKL